MPVPPGVSDEDKPERRCMQKGEKGTCGKKKGRGGMKLEKVKEDRKCFG